MTFHLRAATDQDRFICPDADLTKPCAATTRNTVCCGPTMVSTWPGRARELADLQRRYRGGLYQPESRQPGAVIRELYSRTVPWPEQAAGYWSNGEFKACAQGRGLLRLTVFKTNPAKALISRFVLRVRMRWCMERDCRPMSAD